MADHFGCADVAHLAACFKVAARGHAIEEPRRELIAGTCGIHGGHLGHRYVDTFALADQRHAVAEDDVRVIDVFPDDSHDPIVYPAAVVAASAAESAPAFVEFLNGETAGRVFRDWGFKRPGGGD